MQTQLVFTVDPNTCIKCKTCEMSCNEYYNLTGVHRRSVLSFTVNNDDSPTHISLACTHCLNPVCIYVCPENNYQKRRDGIVVLEASQCNTCRKCIEACPVQAPKLNPHTNRIDKCNFCVERISEDLRPVCIENCVTGALGMMSIGISELKKLSQQTEGVPLASYTKPALYIVEKQGEQIFKREGK